GIGRAQVSQRRFRRVVGNGSCRRAFRFLSCWFQGLNCTGKLAVGLGARVSTKHNTDCTDPSGADYTDQKEANSSLLRSVFIRGNPCAAVLLNSIALAER